MANPVLISALRGLAPIFRMDFLMRATGRHLLMPVYHLATDLSAPHISHIYRTRRLAEFRADLDFLLRHYRPISIGELWDSLKDGKLPEGKCFFLSFDDGLRQVYSEVAPILKEKNVPAAVFLNSAFIDNEGLFFRYKASLLIDQLDRSRKKGGQLRKFWALLNSRGIKAADYKTALLGLRHNQSELLDETADLLRFDFVEWTMNTNPT